MKKYLLVALCSLLLVLVTGCGNKNEVVCTGSGSQNGITVKAEITAGLDASDKIQTLSITYEFDNETHAQQFCAAFQMLGGESTAKIECSGKKMTMSGIETITGDEEDEKVVGVSKADFIKLVEEQEEIKMTCK